MAIMSEKESREVLFSHAKKYGCVEQLQKLLMYYEDLLKGARSKEEKEAIQETGLCAIDKFFGGFGQFTVIKY